MKVSYLGPPGTFSEEALQLAAGGQPLEAVPRATIHDAVTAVEAGAVDLGFVPFENSIEGTVRPTLDALAFEAPGLEIAGEHDHRIHAALISGSARDLAEIEVVVSHPQAAAQCARFLREELPYVEIRSTASTGEAVMQVAGGARPWAALGSSGAARRYGCVVLRDGVEDEEDNVTRFVWIRPASGGPGPPAGTAARTTLVFAELGADRPGALADVLRVFADRGVNLTRIESRPRRDGLGRYLFFVDLEGSLADAAVGDAVSQLRSEAEMVRVLGSYPIGGPAPLR